ncbi:MAG: hypothetical protein RLY43_1677, partial [Bacteroidota bacterium]
MKLKQLEDLDNPQLEQKINRFADMAINNKIAFYQMKIQHDAAVLQNVLSRIGGTSNHRDYAQVQKDGSMFLHEELTRIDTVAIEATPAQFTTRQIWKVRNVGAGFRALKQPFYERQGKAVFMGDAQTDATKETGRVSAEKTSDLKQVRKCFDWYEIDLFDIESMMVAGEQLDTQKGIALREGIEALLNDTVFFGYKQAGIYGFFDHAVTAKDVYKEIAPTAGASTYYDWARKTASEIYDDIDKLATACFDATNGQIDTKILVVPPKQYKRLYSARFGDVIGDTVAKRLLDNNIVTK